MIVVQRYASGVDAAAGANDPSESDCIHLQFPSKKQDGACTRIAYRTDERCAFVRMPGWCLYAVTPVGLECYPDLTQLIVKAPILGREQTLKCLEDLRLIAFVAFCEQTEEVYFGRSLDGFGSMFFAGAGSNLIVSDSRLTVARMLGPITLSRLDREVWCAQSALDPEGSFLEGVKRSFAGCLYASQSDARRELDRRLMAPTGSALNETDSVRLLHDGLMGVFATYGDRRVALRLSGGVDSRVLLAALLEAVKQGILSREQVLCISVLFPGLDCDESAEIRQITQFAGFEWVGIDASFEKIDQAYKRCLRRPAPSFPTSFMGELCMTEAKQRGARVMISGHGGDEIFDYDLVDLLHCTLKERVQRRDLIRQLRDMPTVTGEIKTLLSISFGRRAMRSMTRVLNACHLPAGSLHAHRLGRRTALAHGCGYENAAWSAADAGMLIDAPLLRGPFFDYFDPMPLAFVSDDPYKSIAFAYMHAWAPELSRIPAKKVSFRSAVAQYLTAFDDRRVELDAHSTLRYSAARAYTEWRATLAAGGFEVHEEHV